MYDKALTMLKNNYSDKEIPQEEIASLMQMGKITTEYYQITPNGDNMMDLLWLKYVTEWNDEDKEDMIFQSASLSNNIDNKEEDITEDQANKLLTF